MIALVPVDVDDQSRRTVVPPDVRRGPADYRPAASLRRPLDASACGLELAGGYCPEFFGECLLEF